MLKKFKASTGTFSLLSHLLNTHGIEEKKAATNKLTQYFGTSSASEVATTRDKHYLLARRLVLLCSRSLISFNSASGEGFADFLKSYGITVDFHIPHRTTLTRTALDDVYREAIAVIKDIISRTKYSSLTFDIWTDNYRRKSYVTFNYCHINDDFMMQIINLGTLLMPYRHRSEDVVKEFHKILALFGINKMDTYSVTDQGSNLKKLIKDENLKNPFCLGHGFHNLINVDGFQAVPEIDFLLTKIKKIVRALRFRSTEVEEEVSFF